MAADLRVRLKKIIKSQLKVGSLGFGGPLATMAFMRDELVVRERLVSDARYLEGLAVVKLLPGPVSTLLSIFLGQQIAGWVGGVVSGLCYILPAFVMMLLVALVREQLPPQILASVEFRAVMKGVQVAVISVVLYTCWKLFKDAGDRVYAGRQRKIVVLLVAALAFVAGLLAVPELLILVLSGLAGVAVMRISKEPLVPPDRLRVDLLLLFGVFFVSGLTVFGTGYMVLPHLQRVLVEQHQWLSVQDFLDSVAWGNLTPGPIVIASTYMGYVIGGLPASLAATLGIFAGPFVLMLVLSPLLTRFLGRPWVEGVLLGVIPAVAATVTAGLISLAKAIHWDGPALAIGIIALVLSFRRWPVVRVFALSAILGWGAHWL